MPQTATQTNRKNTSRQPGPVPSTSELQTEDHVYGLVSVLYHALQGAETYEKYVDDAERAGDDELVKFFEQCRDQENERASRAKSLLVLRIDEDEEDEDDVEAEQPEQD